MTLETLIFRNLKWMKKLNSAILVTICKFTETDVWIQKWLTEQNKSTC